MASITQLQYTEQRLAEEIRTIENTMAESVQRRKQLNEEFWPRYGRMDRFTDAAQQAKQQFTDDLNRMIELEVLMQKRKTKLVSELNNERGEARLNENAFMSKVEVRCNVFRFEV
ncbi:unnamed protein product [Clonostachys chloroleuca]|uniref:Uncharacterized protein n=1 Tax=Clonostachys chloroleuca TaxID=1926264 RepID=A0AA35Q558_9HYPO|nr:unnamed protein product [Clonostachys chloroleuca]